MRHDINNEHLLSLTDLAYRVNLSNTMGGGIAPPLLHVSNNEDGIILKFSTASLTEENYQVNVRGYLLQIFTAYGTPHNFGEHPSEKQGSNPRLLQQIPLAPNIDLDSIDAAFKKGALFVYLPFKEDVGNRDIDIRSY